MGNEHITIDNNKKVKFLIPRYLCVFIKHFIREEIKCRLGAENSFYYSVKTLLSSRLLSKDLQLKYKITVLPVGLYYSNIWYSTLKHRLWYLRRDHKANFLTQ